MPEDVPEIGNYRRDPYTKTWDVRVNEDEYIQCKSQFRADILGRIVKIELSVKRIEKALNIKSEPNYDDIKGFPQS